MEVSRLTSYFVQRIIYLFISSIFFLLFFVMIFFFCLSFNLRYACGKFDYFRSFDFSLFVKIKQNKDTPVLIHTPSVNDQAFHLAGLHLTPRQCCQKLPTFRRVGEGEAGRPPRLTAPSDRNRLVVRRELGIPLSAESASPSESS